MAIELRANKHGLTPNPSPEFIELCELANKAYYNRKLVSKLFTKYLQFVSQLGDKSVQITVGKYSIGLYYEQENRELCFFEVSLTEPAYFSYSENVTQP
jgi:hypothetical protein